MDKEKVLQTKFPVRKVKGIGEKTEEYLARLDIYTIGDLIDHFPRDYDIYEQPIPIKSIFDLEESKHLVTVKGKVDHVYPIKRVRNLKILRCRVTGESSQIYITWFNMPYLRSKLRIGSSFIFRGKVSHNKGLISMEHPEIFSENQYVNKMNIMQPIYPLTSGISNKQMTKFIRYILDNVDLSKDPLPNRIKEEYNLITYEKAIRMIHFPKSKEEANLARTRLVFDEFFLFTFVLQSTKEKRTLWYNNFNIEDKKEVYDFIESLPYRLTNAQLRAWNEIKNDLTGTKTMNRLIQGDVGSGKTIIASLALFLCVLNGYQGSIMVPTEVLARQHFESLTKMFDDYDIKIELLVGSLKAKQKQEAYQAIKDGQVDIVVGTHAIIQDTVEFNNLALVITDEQHRFGVKQRGSLSDKGIHPHVLVMSATPIPRTLAIILYSDLEISVIDEMPANRLAIKNAVVDISYRKTAYNFIANQVSQGRQAYIVCPMVEESEVMDGENVIDYTQKLKSIFPKSIKVEGLHGQMKAKEKNEIMEAFANNDIQILVSTTVIEVGINVPNATVMMIEDAHRFGLAQLHQLRGRVGRGQDQSYCIFVNGSKSKVAKERLEILLHSNDGFEIARQDLKMRGPGDMLGVRQSGIIEFTLGDIYTDSDALIKANEAIKTLSKEEIEYIINTSLPLYSMQKRIYNSTL